MTHYARKPLPVDSEKSSLWALSSLGSSGAGPYAVQLFDLVNRETHRAHRLKLETLGVGLDPGISGSYGSSDYVDFRTPRAVNFFDFDGTDMTVRETNIGLYSWTTVSFWGMSVRIAGGGLNIPGLGVSNGVAKVLFSDGIALGVVNLEVRMPRPSPEPEPFREISMEDAIVYRLPGDLLFPFDKHQLIPGQRTADALNRIGNALSNESSEYRFLVIGHTDSIGSAHYNSRLSKRRAETVASWLTGHNYARADSIKTIGRGFEEPVETNSTKAGRAQNRRVEVVVIKKNLWEAYRAD